MEFTRLKQKVKTISILNKIKKNEIYLKSEELYKQDIIEKDGLNLLKNIEATLSSFRAHEASTGSNVDDRYMFSQHYYQALTNSHNSQMETVESEKEISSGLRLEAESLYNINKNICKKLRAEQVNIIKYKDMYNAKV